MCEERKEYKIAFSFAGEDIRGYVKSVAESLVKEYGYEKKVIFYDDWYKSKLAIVDLNNELKKIYSKQTELIVPVFTKGYKKTEWCKIEWKEIRKIIKSNKHSVLLVKKGPVGIKSLNWIKKDGYIDCTSLSASELAKHIIERLEDISSKIPLTFTNRNKELEEILDGKRQFHLVRAPFAYGRTTFIDKLEEEYNKRGWIVKKSTDLEIFDQDNISQDLSKNTHNNFEAFTKTIQSQWDESKGLAILVDLPRTAGLEAPELILSGFFDSIQTFFNNVGIPFGSNNSRLIVATHRLDANDDRFNSHLLSEFTYEVIHKSATIYLQKNELITKNAHTDCVTAKLFYATGGYPNCVRLYLENFPRNINNTTSYLKAAENNFANSISPESRILFLESSIMCYRFIDRDIIEKLPPQSLKKDVSNIISNLLTNDGYHTFKVKGESLLESLQIISDGLMRRVYAAIYREKDKKKFVSACSNAAKLYLEYLENSHIDKKFSFLWLKEYWFQLLQGGQVENSLPLNQKKITNSLFLFLKKLGDEYPQYYLILKRQLEEDWEFQFIMNFDSFQEAESCYNPSKFKGFMEFIEKQYQNYHQRQGA